MNDSQKTKQQLIDELKELRRRVSILQAPEEEMRKIQDRLELALKGADLGLWDYNLKTGEAFINERRSEMVGYSADELGPHVSSWGKLIHPDDIGQVTNAFNAHVEGRTPLYESEHRLRHKSGEYQWILARGKVVEWDDQGYPVRIVGTTLNITDRKRAEEELQSARNELERVVEERTAELRETNEQLRDQIAESKNAKEALRKNEEQYRAVFDNAGMGIDLLDRDGRIVKVNKALSNMLGYAEDELRQLTFLDITHPEDRETSQRNLELLMAGEIGSYRLEKRYVKKDGSVVWADLWTTTIRDENGECKGMVAVIDDITRRKRAEAALRASEKQYRDLVENANDIVYRADTKGFFELFNSVGLRITGFSQEEITHKHYLDLIHPDYKNRVERFYGLQFVKRIPDTYNEVPIITKKGETVWIGQNVQLVMEGDAIVGFQSIARDISDRKKAEEELRKSETLLNSIIEQSPFSMFICDTEGTLIKINPACKKWVRVTDEDVVGKYNLLKDEAIDAQGFTPMVRRVFENGEQASFELEWDSTVVKHLRHKDAFKLILSVTIFPVKDAEGRITNAVCQHIDITERKRAEEALRESEEKYRILVERAHEGILVTQDALIKFLNPKIEEITGYSQEELLFKHFAVFMHPEDREMVFESHFRRLRGEDFPSRYAFRILTKDGDVKWVETGQARIRWEGRPAAQTLITDITERKQMEEALKESEEWYRSLVENSFDGIFVQKDYKIIFANSHLHNMLGYSEGELEGLDHWLIYHPDYQEIIRERARARMRGDKVITEYEVKLLRKDGSSLDGEVSARAVTVKGGPGVQVWVRDLSKRKRLEEVQRRLSTAIEQAGEAIVITDRRGIVEYVNPAHERRTGYTREEVVGSLPPLFKEHELDPEFRQTLADSIARGAVWSGRLNGRRKDGAFYET
ncbi:MAG TPA: PAS domain S-box protein, partial [Desulfomonilaceae bacterium]|nr:PAS domain S-box protein [Desulfomonilaceae bacterium]